jgi:hypothetical protein
MSLARGQRTANLVILLSKQWQWDVMLALWFLWKKYKLTYKPWAFADYLAKSWDIIITHTTLYP